MHHICYFNSIRIGLARRLGKEKRQKFQIGDGKIMKMAANNTTSIESFSSDTSYTERIIIASVLGTISLLGVTGNLMVVIGVALSKTLRTKTNVFVVNLSICDMLASLSMPWWSVALLSEDQWLIPGAEWICTASGIVMFTTIGISVWTVTFIAINRLILITRPLALYQKVYTSSKIGMMLVFCWMLTIVVVGMPTFVGFGRIGYVPETHTCSDVLMSKRAVSYDLYQGIFTALLLIIIIACYIIIFAHVRRHFGKRKRSLDFSMAPKADTEASLPVHHNDPNRHKKIDQDMIKITTNLFICVVIMIVCFLPVSTVNTVDVPTRFRVYALVFAFANSAVNPFVYAWRHPHFKVVLRLMLRCRYSAIPQPSNFLQKYLTTDAYL